MATSKADEVLECPGGESQGFAPGDRVASNGPHAEIIAVPYNLCAEIPDGVRGRQEITCAEVTSL